MGAELRLEPDRLGKVPRTGAVESVQGAEINVGDSVSRLLTRGFLEQAATAYWRLIPRFTLSRVRVRMEVHNFYLWLRGTGPFAKVGVWIYAQTQQRIHRAVTRRFLERLAQTTR